MDQLKMDINIERSTKTNATKLEKYKARNECLDDLRSNIHKKLSQVVQQDSNQYKKTYENLILQGMIKLMEPEVLL